MYTFHAVFFILLEWNVWIHYIGLCQLLSTNKHSHKHDIMWWAMNRTHTYRSKLWHLKQIKHSYWVSTSEVQHRVWTGMSCRHAYDYQRQCYTVVPNKK